MAMSEEPRVAADYAPGCSELVRRTCLEVATRLGDFREQMCVVGGLVPSLIIDQAHRGAAGVIDFHALRHTFITNLARGGVHPKLAQDLARYSDINLTMSRYSHTELAERAKALASLPGTQTAGNQPPAVLDDASSLGRRLRIKQRIQPE